jgi:hypothetical protein
MMQNGKYKVYHSSEIPMVGADEATYIEPKAQPEPYKHWAWYEILGAWILHNLGKLLD